jgi:hypothetical protein
VPAPPEPGDIIELGDHQAGSAQRPVKREARRSVRPTPKPHQADRDAGEEEFWELTE